MDELTNYIKQQLKQKMKVKDIVNGLVSSNYKKSDVYLRLGLIYGKLTLIVLLSLFVFSIVFLFILGLIEDSGTVHISELVDDDVKISVSDITDGDSYLEGVDQVYYLEELKTTTIFSLEGFYTGLYFKDVFYNEEGILKMSLNTNMDPNDGVVEGFILEKINDVDSNNITAYIYVDEDWKIQIPDTKIFWGSNYQYYVDYIFEEVEEGIYLTMIIDDPNRFANNFSISYGGIAVGDLEVEDIVNNDVGNKTFMRLFS